MSTCMIDIHRCCVYTSLPVQLFFRVPGELIFEKKYQNTHYNSLLEATQHFLRESGVTVPPRTACFAVAGPVADNRVVFTNRPTWNADGEQVCVKYLADFKHCA